MPPKFPHVTVKLVGRDGNAFNVLGSVLTAMHRAGVPRAERDQFVAEATSGNYDNLLQVVMRWVEVE